MNQDIVNYIKQSQNQGLSREQIVRALKTQGWLDKEINEAFQAIEVVPRPVSETLSKNKSLLPIIGIVMIALFVAGGSIFAALYTNTWSPTWNPFKPTPQEVIARMVSENKEIDLFKIEAIVELLQDGENGSESLIRVTSSDLVDESNYDEPKSISNALIRIGMFGELQPTPAKVIFIGESGYIQVDSNWSRLDVLDPFYSVFNPSDPRYSEGPLLYFGDSQLYTIEEEFLDEKLNGTNVYHYKLSLDPEVALKIDSGLEELPNSVSAELWIDKRSKRLLQSIIIVQVGELTNYAKLEFSYPEKLYQAIESPIPLFQKNE